MLRNCVHVLLVFALKVGDSVFYRGWPCGGNCMSARTCWVLCFVFHANWFLVFNVRRVGGASAPSVDSGCYVLSVLGRRHLATRTPDRPPLRSYPIGC